MCNLFQKSESWKYREKRFGYPDPYPVPVRRQFLDIRIRLQTHYPAGYPTGQPDSDNLCQVHPVRGESHIQHNTNRVVATLAGKLG